MKNIKPLIMDTTYILPLFGIKIIEITNFKDFSKEIWSNGLKDFNLYLPSTCLVKAFRSFKLTREI